MRKRPEDRDFDIDDFDIEIGPEDPVYPLNVVCQLLEMNYWTVHEIVQEGIITPHKKGRKKLFSQKDMKYLKYIKYLIDDKGVNVQGIKVIFEIRHFEDEGV